MHLHLSADEVLTTTRAVRKRLDFDRPVEREVIEECLQIALQAPSGSNSQGWQWLMVTDPAKKMALADIYRANWAGYSSSVAASALAARGEEGDRRIEQVYSSANYLAEHFQRAPIIMVPCIAADLDRLPLWAAAGVWGSILPAVWSFLLAARERGLGTAWTTVYLAKGGDAQSAELLGIPAGFSQVGMFPIAYTVGTDFKPAARLPLELILHWDTW